MRSLQWRTLWRASALAGVFFTNAFGAPSDLDPTFDGDGILSRDFMGYRHVAIQSDGKIVVAGQTSDGGSPDVLVLRFHSDGSLDEDFGDAGSRTIAIGGNDLDFLGDMAIDTSGRIVVVGFYGQSPISWVIRLDQNGDFDTDFHADGVNVLYPGRAERVLLLDDGRILIGSSDTDQDDIALLAALGEDGTSSFTLDGAWTHSFTSYDRFAALAVQSDGGIVCGFLDSTDLSTWYLKRLNAAGSTDTDFGDDGIAAIDWTGGEVFGDIALDAQDRIVAVGSADERAVMVRLGAAGDIDSTFADDGRLTLTDDDDVMLLFQDVVVDDGGRVLAAGSRDPQGTNSDFFIVRCDSTGAVDVDFGFLGSLTLDLNGYKDQCGGIAMHSDGKIVLAGFELELSTYTGAVVRLLGDDEDAGLLLAIRNVHKKNRSDQLCLVTDLDTGALTTVGNLGTGHTATKAMAVMPGESGDDDRIFAAEGGQLLEIDPLTGEASVIGNIGWSDVTGLAVHPDTDVLYGITYGTNRLLTIDPDTGAGTVVASRVLNSSRLNDLAFHPDGDLYVVTNDSRPRLFRVHATTGRKLERWDLTGATGLESLLWSEDGETLYSAATRNGYKDLCTIDLDTSTIAFVSSTSSAMRDVEGLGWFRGVIGVTKAAPEDGDVEDIDDPDEFADAGATEPVAAPIQLRLHENVPNPFNPATRIEYELPEAGAVHVAVYDVAGRLVATLAAGMHSAGRHATTWNGLTASGERAASGIYFYTLRTGEDILTRSMVLLK